jgi:anaerobic C4-dicarboxylate transporter
METPRLIEPGAQNYMVQVLQTCHSNRVNIYLYVLNISVLALFLLVLAAILYYCHKRKLSPQEAYQKQLKEQDYILSKIRYYKEHQRNISSKASITGLPMTDPRPI